MQIDSAAIGNLITSYYWPLTRIAGIFMLAPVLGGNYVPIRIRAGLTVLVTLIIAPGIQAAPTAALAVFSAEAILITATQVLIGVAMAFMILLVFNAVVVGGESIATTMGLGYALINDPSNGVQVPIVSQFYTIFITLLFMALNGHHALLMLVADSFTYLPVGQPVSSDMLWMLVSGSTVLFTGAVMVALPALAAMLSVNLTMGIMTRAAPQLNVLSIGFPLTMMVGFVVILFTLPVVGASFEQLLSAALHNIGDWLLGG